MGVSAAAFDGGGLDQGGADPMDRQQQNDMQPDYISYHALCMEREMRMWGEAAELMADLATAQCHCEYTELEQAGGFADVLRDQRRRVVLDEVPVTRKRPSSIGPCPVISNDG